MLGYFADPYPDELLYSVYARLWEKLGCKNGQAFSRMVFGSGSAVPSIALPHYLNYLIGVIPRGHSYTSDWLIANNTLFPMFVPFLPVQRVRRIQRALRSSQRGAIQFLLGQKRTSVTSLRYLRYCPVCVQQDRLLHGECYWHRCHQVPEVEVCSHHEVWLEDSQASGSNLRASHAFKSAEQTIRLEPPRFLKPDEPAATTILALARNVFWLLTHSDLESDQAGIRRRYLAALAEQGMATYSGRVKARHLTQAFVHAYPQTCLQRIEGADNALQSGRAALALVRRIRSALSPIHHLLFIHFLGHTAESFFRIPSYPEYFGPGPWPCLNRAASHFHELVTKVCKITMRVEDGRPVGIFRCACGYAYMRVGPDWSPMVRYYAGRVLEYGSVWDQALKRLWKDADLKVEEIADRLGVTPPTVRAQVVRLRLPLRRPSARYCESRTHRWQQPQAIHRASERESQRQEWLIVREKRQLNAEALQRKRQLQRWLRRHDREWFLRHGVPRGKRFPVEVAREQINWEQRDQMFAQLVETTIQRLKASAGKPRRITRTYIIRETGQLRLIAPHLRRLPKTRELLVSAVETEEEYLKRRAAWAVDYLAQRSQAPTPTKLRQLIGGRRVWSKDPDVLKIIADSVPR